MARIAREIKFRFVLENKCTGKIGFLFYSLVELMNLGCHPVNQKDWLILSEDRYTGLKDKNGKEIYEGDVLTENYRDTKQRKSLVEYDTINPCFVLKRIDKKYNHIDYEYDFVQCNILELEVIGNIYENPELVDNEK